MVVLKKFTLLIVPVLLFGQIKGMQELVDLLFPLIVQKRVIKVYTTPKFASLFNHSPFKLVSCKNADIVFNTESNCTKPRFVLSYKEFKHNPNAFGAFYYRKGRPQLRFKRSLLLRYFHTLPQELREYSW